VILHPKSKFGFLITEKYGTEWVLIKKYDSYYMSKRPGPWGRVQPIEGTEFDERWIHLHDDPNFFIARKQ
jgi:hypothetical protein